MFIIIIDEYFDEEVIPVNTDVIGYFTSKIRAEVYLTERGYINHHNSLFDTDDRDYSWSDRNEYLLNYNMARIQELEVMDYR